MVKLVREAFIKAMEKELAANTHKGDWSAWRPAKFEAARELIHHTDKLQMALAIGTPEKVREFAADVANLAMKIEELYGAVRQPEPVYSECQSCFTYGPVEPNRPYCEACAGFMTMYP